MSKHSKISKIYNNPHVRGVIAGIKAFFTTPLSWPNYSLKDIMFAAFIGIALGTPLKILLVGTLTLNILALPVSVLMIIPSAIFGLYVAAELAIYSTLFLLVPLMAIEQFCNFAFGTSFSYASSIFAEAVLAGGHAANNARDRGAARFHNKYIPNAVLTSTNAADFVTLILDGDQRTVQDAKSKLSHTVVAAATQVKEFGADLLTRLRPS